MTAELKRTPYLFLPRPYFSLLTTDSDLEQWSLRLHQESPPLVVKEPIRLGKKEATPQVSLGFDRGNLGQPQVPPPHSHSGGRWTDLLSNSTPPVCRWVPPL